MDYEIFEEGEKTMDACKECEALHEIRVRKINQKISPFQEMHKIEELTEKDCNNPSCLLHPASLWNRKLVEVKIVDVYSCSEGDLLINTTTLRV